MRNVHLFLGSLAVVLLLGVGCAKDVPTATSLDTDAFTVNFLTPLEVERETNTARAMSAGSDEDELGENEFIIEYSWGESAPDATELDSLFTRSEAIDDFVGKTATYYAEPVAGSIETVYGSAYLVTNASSPIVIRVYADTASGMSSGVANASQITWK